MYTTMEEFLSELPLHLALFACGAVGWAASRWAGRRFGTPRKPAPSPKLKLCTADSQDDGESASSDTCSTASPCASSLGFSPHAPSPAKRLSSGARRRASRRAAAAAVACEEGGKAAEQADDAAEQAEAAQRADSKESDKVKFDDSATSSTVVDSSSQDGELEAQACCEASLDQSSAVAANPLGEEPPVTTAAAEPPAVGDQALESEVAKSEATEEPLIAKQVPSMPTTSPVDHSGVCMDDVQDAQPVEAVVSDRVAKMLAKKAERKARKAEERKLLEEQLAAQSAKEAEVDIQGSQVGKADFQGEEEEEETEEKQEEEEEDATESLQADKTGTTWWVDIIEDAPLDSEASEPDQEPPFCGAATWSGPDSAPRWPELNEVHVDRCRTSSWSKPTGRQQAWSWAAPSKDEWKTEDEWRTWTAPSRGERKTEEDEWMVPLEEMSGPPRESSLEGCESSVAQALDPNISAYKPIISEDGQQLYTDGQQVYMMAAMMVDTGVPTDEAPQVITPVVNPCDPLHQTFMGLSAAAAMGSQSPASVGAPASWPAAADDAFYYDEDSQEEELDDEDALWGVCWDFAR